MMAISVPKRKAKYNQTCMLRMGKFGSEKVVALAPGSCPAVLPGVGLILQILLLHLVQLFRDPLCVPPGLGGEDRLHLGSPGLSFG